MRIPSSALVRFPSFSNLLFREILSAEIEDDALFLKIIENLLSSIYQLGFEYKIIVFILWIVIMFLLLRKLAKKDNEFYLKDFFKKKNN